MSHSPSERSHSRECTPMSSASSSQTRSLDRGTNSSMSIGEGSGIDDAEKFRKRMEMEQTMQVLQQRLKLASLKAENGWKDMSINEIETQLPPTPKRGKRDISIAIDRVPGVAYEPPSPSRPWQLIDVLWQPLPPPSNGRYPASPSSPLKRSRNDDSRPYPPPPASRHARRASGSAASAHFHVPQSPVTQFHAREKKRSQSHSHQRLKPSLQDVDAAHALTEMLSGSPRTERAGSNGPSRLPPAWQSRSRSSSVHPPHAAARSPDEDDKDAAELMMFLAHSPSPASTRAERTSPPRSIGGAARVLFADEPGKVEKHSNLALAPPITASLEDPPRLLSGDVLLS